MRSKEAKRRKKRDEEKSRDRKRKKKKKEEEKSLGLQLFFQRMSLSFFQKVEVVFVEALQGV